MVQVTVELLILLHAHIKSDCMSRHPIIGGSTDLFPILLHDEEGIGPIRHSEGKVVFQRVAAVMTVTDAVLVDVLHREGRSLPIAVSIVSTLNQAVAGGLDNGEGDGFSLCTKKDGIHKELEQSPSLKHD